MFRNSPKKDETLLTRCINETGNSPVTLSPPKKIQVLHLPLLLVCCSRVGKIKLPHSYFLYQKHLKAHLPGTFTSSPNSPRNSPRKFI